MRFADILRISLTALGQQKVRTFLTMAGVVVGTFALATSLSLGRGFEAEVMRQVTRRDQLRQVLVFPNSEVKETDVPPEELRVAGDMSDDKRERLRKGRLRRLTQRGSVPRKTVYLTPERLHQLEKLDHVEAVKPFVQLRVTAELLNCAYLFPQPSYPEVGPAVSGSFSGATAHRGRAPGALGIGAAVDDERLRHRIVAGSHLPTANGHTLVIGEYLLYRWGITSEEDVSRVVGQKLRVEFRPGRPLPPPDVFGLGSLFTPNAEEGRVLDKALKQLPRVRDELGLTSDELATLNGVLQRLPLGNGAGNSLVLVSRVRGLLGGVLAGAPWGPLHVLPHAFLRVDEPLAVADFTIVGVFREYTEEDDTLGMNSGMSSRTADLFLPANTARDLFLLVPRSRDTGFDSALLVVDREENVRQVGLDVKALGLREFSLSDWIARMRASLVLATLVTSFLAITALVVAGLGITNTMIMSVLERRREIGVMKAVGARDSHIQLIFLLEGALIGGIGGALGMLCCWLASLPGDSFARHILEEQNQIPLKGTLFVFPWWLTAGVPFFAALVTTAAALYPARRAARVNPITALRHE